MDLGADGWQTFRYVTLPMIATALVAGGLLAFALSFDEVVVTTFTAGAQNTLPIWIFGNIRLGQQLPQVNVVVLFVILLSMIPVALAQRLTRDTGVLRGRTRTAARGRCPSRCGSDARQDPAAQTPYLDALREYAARDPARLHVPGHKGGPGADAGLLEAIGERGAEHGHPGAHATASTSGAEPTPFEQAQRLAAEAWGARARVVPGQRRLAGQPRGGPRARPPRATRWWCSATRTRARSTRSCCRACARPSSRPSSTPSSGSRTA